MIASPLKDQHEGLRTNQAIGDVQVLPAAIIYGGNASGKSNFVSAINLMRACIIHSHTRGTPDGGVPRHPFELAPEGAEKSSSFEASFVAKGKRYEYGFVYDDDRFTEEWLFAFPNGRRQSLFTRSSQEFNFGRNLKGRNKIISEITRPNSLFVSSAAQNDHEELGEIYSYFRKISIIKSISIAGRTISEQFKDSEIDPRSILFLKEIGAGIVDYRRGKVEAPEPIQKFEKGLIEFIKKANQENPSAIMNYDQLFEHNPIELGHSSKTGQTVYFDIDDESSGTRRLLFLLSSVFRAIDDGSILIVDEIDASLHTQACEAIIALFHSKLTNKIGAQIIATTHDTNLLQAEFLRRDQVWFCEKDESGETDLFPLSDISVKKTDNIEKGYLQGRFGATPLSKTALRVLLREISEIHSGAENEQRPI
ncbi:AAA family ATPase [Mesorhizobium amorphae]